jgi:hypothetical protein
MVQLLLQIPCMMITDRFGQERAEQAANSPGQRRRGNHQCERSNGCNDRAGRRRCPDVHEPTNETTLGIAYRLGRRVAAARNDRIVFEFGDLAILVAELFCRRSLLPPASSTRRDRSRNSSGRQWPLAACRDCRTHQPPRGSCVPLVQRAFRLLQMERVSPTDDRMMAPNMLLIEEIHAPDGGCQPRQTPGTRRDPAATIGNRPQLR